jgi:hypothetical protein
LPSNVVDDRSRVLDICGEVDPAIVGRQERRSRSTEQLRARFVERRHVGVAATRDVDRSQVERQAEQVVAQGVDDELVDLVAALDRHAAHDGAGRLIMRDAAVVAEGDGIEE